MGGRTSRKAIYLLTTTTTITAKKRIKQPLLLSWLFAPASSTTNPNKTRTIILCCSLEKRQLTADTPCFAMLFCFLFCFSAYFINWNRFLLFFPVCFSDPNRNVEEAHTYMVSFWRQGSKEKDGVITNDACALQQQCKNWVETWLRVVPLPFSPYFFTAADNIHKTCACVSWNFIFLKWHHSSCSFFFS